MKHDPSHLEWSEFAEADFRTACLLAGCEDGDPRIVCFHAQQAAEKWLKAVLVCNAETVKRFDSYDEFNAWKREQLLKLAELPPEEWQIPTHGDAAGGK